MENKVALIVGRFQPFHKGHLYLVKKALEKAEKIVFGIGSANIHDEYNPLSYEQRKKMLEIMIKEEDIEDKVKGIVALDDVYNNEKWLKIVKEKAGLFDLVVSNSEWTNRILEKAGYDVWRLGYYKKNLYEGWRIRKLISKNKDFKKRVPTYLCSFLMSKLKCQMSKKNQKTNQQTLSTNYYYIHSILGGTFDHFHLGHEKFIKTAFEKSAHVTIGLATKKIYQGKLLAETIQSYSIRKNSLINFLKQKKILDRSNIIPLFNIYGNGNKEEKIDAIFVTENTYKGALEINKKRKERGWQILKIEKVPMVKGTDGKDISSERIRMGEIDERGNNFYFSIFNFQKKELILPEELRDSLRKPIGKVFDNIHKVIKYIKLIKPAMVTAVGDIIVSSLIEKGIDPDVKIIDFKSRRKEFLISNFKFSLNYKFPILKKHKNNPGTINFQTANILKEKIQKAVITKEKQWLVVDGEEDLLTLPAILFAPLDSLVIYGQYNLGVVMVLVDEKTKKIVQNILQRFKL